MIIGVDPHKGSHTAVAVGGDEAQLAKVRVRSSRRQLDQLLNWAEPFEQRTRAIESAGGLGYLLAQQLVAAGEHVLDVPATLAARVRVLGTGRSKDPCSSGRTDIRLWTARIVLDVGPSPSFVSLAPRLFGVRSQRVMDLDRVGNRRHPGVSEAGEVLGGGRREHRVDEAAERDGEETLPRGRVDPCRSNCERTT